MTSILMQNLSGKKYSHALKYTHKEIKTKKKKRKKSPSQEEKNIWFGYLAKLYEDSQAKNI